MYQRGSCSYRRSVSQSDEIEFPKLAVECPVLYLFKDQVDLHDETSSAFDKDSCNQEENIHSVNDDELRTADSNEMNIFIEKIEYKLEEIKDLLKKIKDIRDQQSN